MTGINSKQTVWNFCGTSTLTFHNVAWKGSVLAPFADITNPNGVVWGQVFANSWTVTGNACMQQNWVPFEGCIDECTWQPSSSFCTFSQEDYSGTNCETKRFIDTCFAHLTIQEHFSTCFPIGLRLGGGEVNLVFSSSSSLTSFLPQTGAPGVLDASYKDVTTTPAGAFAGELAALGLSIGLDRCGDNYASACYHFEDIVVCDNDQESPCSAFSGLNIASINARANMILGGETVEGVSVSDAFKCIRHINQMFVGCSSFLQHRHEFNFCSCDEESCEAKPASVLAMEEMVNPSDGGQSAGFLLTPAFAVMAFLFTLF